VTKQQTRKDLEIGTWKSTLRASRTKLDQDSKLKIQKWNVTNKWQAFYLEVVNCNMFGHNQKSIEIEQVFWNVELECRANLQTFSSTKFDH
jgi:hypothetical protein